MALNFTQGETRDYVGAQVIINLPHHETHEGEMCTVSYKSPEGADVADNGTILLRLLTPAHKLCHFVYGVDAGGDAEVEFLEAPTIDTAGTAMTEYDMNRYTRNTPEATAFLNPTITGGTLLFHSLVAGGTGGNASGGSGVVRPDTEWILNPSTNYVLRVTNRAGSAKPMSCSFQWYEEDLPVT